MAELRERARHYHAPVLAEVFVTSEISPTTGKLNYDRSTSMRDGKLTFSDLLVCARSWDVEGATSVGEFLDYIACEVVGTPEHQVISETIRTLGYD